MRGAVLGASPVTVVRLQVATDLSAYVRNAWFVDWDVPVGTRQSQAVLAPPAVNISIQPDVDAVTGVQTRVDQRVLEGRSWVRGLLFRPAGFAAVVGPEMHRWVDRREPVGTHLVSVQALRAALLDSPDAQVQLRSLESWLRPQIRDDDAARREQVEAIVDEARTDRSLTRVAGLAGRVGVSERTLHRLLRAWVGIGPKALLCRYRMHEAAHRLTEAPKSDLAEVAYALGYADQAHFTRDFKKVIGLTPGSYCGQLTAR